MPYQTEVNDLTVPRVVGELTDLFGNVIGYQQVASVVPKAGTVLEDDDVSPAVRERVEKGELVGLLSKVGESELRAQQEAGPEPPFPGFEQFDDDVEGLRAVLATLPSEAIQAVKRYEAEFGQGRVEIVEFDIGRGEASVDRLVGRAGSRRDEPDDKPVSEIVTREVGEDDFRFGETFIGDGQPDRPFGSSDGEFESEHVTSEPETEGGDEEPTEESPKARRARRSARRRASEQGPAEEKAGSTPGEDVGNDGASEGDESRGVEVGEAESEDEGDEQKQG